MNWAIGKYIMNMLEYVEVNLYIIVIDKRN